MRTILLPLAFIVAGCAPQPIDSAGTPTATPPTEPAAPAPTAQAPTLGPDPSGRAPMLIPTGWTVAVESEGALTLLRVDETPGVDDSPTLGVLAQTVASGGSPDSVAQIIAASIENGAPVSQTPVSNGSVLYIVQGNVKGVTAKIALMATTDGTHAYAAFFIAPASRFDTLGGGNLLLAAFGAAPAPAPAAPIANAPDVMSYQGQLDMLANKQPVTPVAIVGSWSQGSGASTGDVYQNVVDGSLSYDAIGHGNHFSFKADGTYAYVHQYSHTYGSCRNQLQRSETGNYRFDGSTLTLKPNGFDAALCSCCAGAPTNKRHPQAQPRVYEVAVHAGKNHMVIRGTCPEFMVSCLGEDDQRYLREGFTRSR